MLRVHFRSLVSYMLTSFLIFSVAKPISFLFSNKKGGTGLGWEGSSRTVIERGGGERRFVTGGDLEEK